MECPARAEHLSVARLVGEIADRKRAADDGGGRLLPATLLRALDCRTRAVTAGPASMAAPMMPQGRPPAPLSGREHDQQTLVLAETVVPGRERLVGTAARAGST